MQAALKFEELVQLEELYFQLTEEDRLEALTEMYEAIRNDERGANCAVEELHDDFHNRPKPKLLQGHGVPEGAAIMKLLLPFSVAEHGPTATPKLGKYSEALVELGLRENGSEPGWLDCSEMLQEFAVLIWRATRYLGCGKDVMKCLRTEETFLAWISDRKEFFRARLAGAVEARLRVHMEQSASVDL